MDKFYHWLEEGFIQAGTFFISDKYTQGVDVEFIVDRKDWYVPGVYIFADKQGNVLKIGESGKLADRMFNQYKCIDNVTNNRIRESLKADYKKVNFFNFFIPPFIAICCLTLLSSSFIYFYSPFENIEKKEQIN